MRTVCVHIVRAEEPGEVAGCAFATGTPDDTITFSLYPQVSRSLVLSACDRLGNSCRWPQRMHAHTHVCMYLMPVQGERAKEALLKLFGKEVHRP